MNSQEGVRRAMRKLRENIRMSGTEIPYLDLEVGHQIGAGAFAAVRKGRLRGQDVAVKLIQVRRHRITVAVWKCLILIGHFAICLVQVSGLSLGLYCHL